jgi:hypothetical protein
MHRSSLILALCATQTGVSLAQTERWASASEVQPYTTSYAVDGISGATTYEVGIHLSDMARNCYTQAGTALHPTHLPPARQVSAPFGADVAGTNPAYWPYSADCQYDSWLTVGKVDGSSGVSSIGIDFGSWTPWQGLPIPNGAIFWMSPNDAAPMRAAASDPPVDVVVAHFTVTTGSLWTYTIGELQGRSIGAGAADWKMVDVAFNNRPSNPPPPPTSTICPAGEFFASPAITHNGMGACMVCQAGQYNSRAGAQACTACAAGQYSSMSGASSCFMCAVGQYSDATGSVMCRSCPTGRTIGSASCTAAPPPTTPGVPTCPLPVEPNGAWSASPTGTFTAGSSTSLTCNAGFQPSTAFNERTITTCDTSGQWIDLLSTCLQSPPPPPTSTICPAGEFFASPAITHNGMGACMVCQAGQYNSRAGAQACTACAAGQYSSMSGASSCFMCAVGQYSDATGSVMCRSCPTGRTIGSASCTAAPPPPGGH